MKNHKTLAAISILTVVLFAVLPAFAATQAGFEARCTGYTPSAVDISPLTDFYNTLPPDEKDEQLKDWAFYGLLASLGFTADEADDITGQPAHMRYSALKKKYGFTVSPGRAAFLENGNCVMLVPRGEVDDKLTQGFIFDKFRAAGDPVPKNITL